MRDKMTVGELRKKLEEFDDNATIFIKACDGWYELSEDGFLPQISPDEATGEYRETHLSIDLTI